MHDSVPRASGKSRRVACIGRRMERAVSTRPGSTRAMGVSKHAMDTGGRQETCHGCDKHPAQKNPEILPHFGGSCIKRWARMVTAAACFSFSVFSMRHLPGILLRCKSPPLAHPSETLRITSTPPQNRPVSDTRTPFLRQYLDFFLHWQRVRVGGHAIRATPTRSRRASRRNPQLTRPDNPKVKP